MRNQQDAAQAICAMMNTPDGKRLMALLGADGGKTLRYQDRGAWLSCHALFAAQNL